MERCVIYARVSTKEQQDEGYSIPAQMKAMRAYCAAEGLLPVAEFVEAESAGHTGRNRFSAMVAHLKANPDVRIVVAHKLDRLYRNFADPVLLEEELGVRARYVLGDVPDTPQGELLRDVQLSVAKYYLGNLREEVKKGMDEKVAQGGWPHRAPLGYLNDKNTRSVVPDPDKASLVRLAFSRYASGLLSVKDLASELASAGLVSASGGRIYASALHKVLSNPFYCGRIRHKGVVTPGAHEPLISPALFESVQEQLAGNRQGNKAKRHAYALRGIMYCAECGCKITAGTHKGHVYYRCTHGKGECGQRSYTREELLMQQVEALLARVEIGPDIVAALAADAGLLESQRQGECEGQRLQLEREIAANKAKDARLLDAYLEGSVPVDSYRTKAEGLSELRGTLELRLHELSDPSMSTAALVEARARQASLARLGFANGDEVARREIASGLLCNLRVRDGRIASYQYKDPFGVLEMDSSGAFCRSWWAMKDLNLRPLPCEGSALPLSQSPVRCRDSEAYSTIPPRRRYPRPYP